MTNVTVTEARMPLYGHTWPILSLQPDLSARFIGTAKSQSEGSCEHMESELRK